MAKEEYLKKISKNTSPKPSFQIVLTGVGSRLNTSFSPPLNFEKGCKFEIALSSLETYYSFPNIDETNNKLKIKIKSKFYNIVIPIGCYELSGINEEIQRQVVMNGGNKDDVLILPNNNTFHSVLYLKNNTEVDFNVLCSLNNILGFEAKLYKEKYQESEGLVNIMRVNDVLVHCDLVGSSYINGKLSPVLYSFFPGVSPGEKLKFVRTR